MLQRGQLVMTNNGTIGLILNIFDAIVYQPMHAEVLLESNVVMIQCNKLRKMTDLNQEQTLEELINSNYRSVLEG
jgi:hypothetical protein